MFLKSPNQKKNESSTQMVDESDNKTTDYQILIGDNSVFDPSTSHNFCHSHSSLTSSHATSFDESTHGYQKVFRDYTSSPHHVLLVIFVATYLLLILLGASVFSIFEQKSEFELRDHILRVQHNFLNKHPSVDPDSLDEFVSQVLKAADSGVDLHLLNEIIKAKQSQAKQPKAQDTDSIKTTQTPVTLKRHENKLEVKTKSKRKEQLDKIVSFDAMEKDSDLANEQIWSNTPTEHSNWEFTSSLLFVTSVVTTIGYGHVTPNTFEGKIFCMIFSCVSIPFTLVFLSIIVSLLKNGPVKKFEKWLIRKITTNFRSIPELFIRILHVIIVTLILLVTILIIPALVFSHVEEEWSFLDSIYYCYISLTTVGLGDFVATTNHLFYSAYLQIYRICIVLYLYGGLALIMLWIAVVLRVPQLNLKPFLLTEKEEINEEETHIIDYNNESKQNNYGTQCFPQK